MKQIRQKFVAAAMSAMFLVLAVMIGTINVVNYGDILRESDKILDILSENEGMFPKDFLHPGKKPDKLWELSPETPYENRFFTVTVNQAGEVIQVNTGHVAAIKTDDAIAMGTYVSKQGVPNGFYEEYRCRELVLNEKRMYIFLDCGRQLRHFKSFFVTSLWMSGLGLGFVFVLVLLFSQMVFRSMEENDRKQKQFITDASHELKTPLTIIDANTEVLEMEYGENEWTKSVHNQVQRLSTMTAELLALARLDERRYIQKKTEFSLSEALKETAEGFAAVANLQEKEFQVQIQEACNYIGDEKAIRELAAILLDNAIKYSSDHGKITFLLEKKGKRYWIRVFNTVEKIDTESLPYLFERFYRADSSRNSHTGGYGIGLSIAKAIVAGQKGKLLVNSVDEKTILFTVILKA